MIQSETLLKVVDNSGAKLAKCIKVKNKGGRACAHVGDIIVVSVQALRPRYGRQSRVRVNKSEVHHGVVVQTKKMHKAKSGFGQVFASNSVALVTPQLKPIGTRISAVLPQRLRSLKWAKLAAMAKKVV